MTASSLRNRAAEASNGDQPSTEVAQFAGEPAPSIARFIQTMQPELARALPAGLDANRMARLALTAIRNNSDLAACSPQSFAGALLTASSLGLEVGTGEAHLVPYKRECTLIIDYRGLAKLFWQSPLAKHLDAQTVYSNDKFDYAYGLGQFLRHKPAKGERGDVVCYYACAELTTGGQAFVVLSPSEVKVLRGGKVGPQGNIADPMRWMERKTALRQLLKMLPRSTQLNMAMDADEKSGTTLYVERIEDKQPALETQTAQQIGSTPTDTQLPPWDGEEPPMTKSQQGNIFGNFAKMGVTDDQLQRQYMTDVLGRPVTEGEHGRSSLTLVEADKVIDAQDMDLRDPGAES